MTFKIEQFNFSSLSKLTFSLFIFFFLFFTLPQMALSQSHTNYEESQEAYQEYLRKLTQNKENGMKDLIHDMNSGMNPYQKSPIKKKRKKNNSRLKFLFPYFFYIIFILGISRVIYLSKNKEHIPPPEIPKETPSLRERQVTAILEQKNLEKIVEEGLATTIIKVRCRSCQQLNEEGAKFCIECGKKV